MSPLRRGTARTKHTTRVFVLLVLVLVGGATVGLIRGGTPAALVRIYVARPRALAAAFAALLLGQVVPGTYAAGWVVATVAVAFFAAANPRLPGLGLLLAGITLNTVVVLANSGQMPVSRWGADRAGVAFSDVRGSSRYTPGDTATVLRPATDAIPLAFPPAPAVVSIGDVLVAAGAGLFAAVAPVRARRTLAARRIHTARPGHPGAVGPAAPDPLASTAAALSTDGP